MYLLLAIAILSIFCIRNSLSSELECGTVTLDGLTWDYFDPANHRATSGVPKGHVKLVENVHLTPKMNSLDTGNTGSGITGFLADLDYVLRRLPNNPKALDMASRFQHLHGDELHRLGKFDPSFTRSAECYFERALQLTPSNPTVHMLYGIHMHRSKKYSDAIGKYKIAESFSKENSAELDYNIALSYFELKQFELANQYAASAYKKGYPLPGLKENLKKIGKWNDDLDTTTTKQEQ
jgi:hypothetical protein